MTMTPRASRRTFLQAAPLALAATGGTLLLGDEPPRSTGSGRDLDSLIGLVIDTPSDRRVSVICEELRKGLSYRDLLSAQYLAAVRIESTHPVAVVHAVNWIAGSLPAREAVLPLVWAFERIGSEIDSRTRYKEPIVVPRTAKAPPPAG